MAAIPSLKDTCLRKYSYKELSDELVTTLLKFFKSLGILNLADDKEWEDLYDKLIITDEKWRTIFTNTNEFKLAYKLQIDRRLEALAKRSDFPPSSEDIFGNETEEEVLVWRELSVRLQVFIRLMELDDIAKNDVFGGLNFVVLRNESDCYDMIRALTLESLIKISGGNVLNFESQYGKDNHQFIVIASSLNKTNNFVGSLNPTLKLWNGDLVLYGLRQKTPISQSDLRSGRYREYLWSRWQMYM